MKFQSTCPDDGTVARRNSKNGNYTHVVWRIGDGPTKAMRFSETLTSAEKYRNSCQAKYDSACEYLGISQNQDVVFVVEPCQALGV